MCVVEFSQLTRIEIVKTHITITHLAKMKKKNYNSNAEFHIQAIIIYFDSTHNVAYLIFPIFSVLYIFFILYLLFFSYNIYYFLNFIFTILFIYTIIF